MDRHPRATLYMKDRAAGMSYREIAAKHGVSYQAVAEACARQSPGRFRTYTPKEVIYPKLRRWLNENRVCRSEFVRRLGNVPGNNTIYSVSDWFAGRYFPRKGVIDRMLAVTGLTYEELFATEEDQGAECEWCQYFKNDPQHLVSEGNGMYRELIYRRCPNCGRKLEARG